MQDTSGRLIDGDHDGQPGGEAVGLLGRGGATIHAVLYQGMGTVPSFEPSAVDAVLAREDLRANRGEAVDTSPKPDDRFTAGMSGS